MNFFKTLRSAPFLGGAIKSILPFSSKAQNLTAKSRRIFPLKFSHVTKWKLDKVTVAFMIFPVIPVAFFLQDNVTDSILALLTSFHMHQGLSSIATDYLPKYPRISKLGVIFITVGLFTSLMFMIHLRGQSLVLFIRKIWSIEPFRGEVEAGYEYFEDDSQID